MAAAMAVLNHLDKKKQKSDDDAETDILLKIPDENYRRYDITMDLLLRGCYMLSSYLMNVLPLLTSFNISFM
jgi:hypothetical protein